MLTVWLAVQSDRGASHAEAKGDNSYREGPRTVYASSDESADRVSIRPCPNYEVPAQAGGRRRCRPTRHGRRCQPQLRVAPHADKACHPPAQDGCVVLEQLLTIPTSRHKSRLRGGAWECKNRHVSSPRNSLRPAIQPCNELRGRWARPWRKPQSWLRLPLAESRRHRPHQFLQFEGLEQHIISTQVQHLRPQRFIREA